MKIDLTKKYRIWWKEKTLSASYNEPHSLNTITTLSDEYWNYFECDTVAELENKVKEENLNIEKE